jgi:hypothetical protein
VLINAFFGSANWGGTTGIYAKLLRDSTAIAGGANDAFYNTFVASDDTSATPKTHSLSFLDSPATASAITYKVQLAAGATSTAYVNRTRTTPDASTSTITVMEVAG